MQHADWPGFTKASISGYSCNHMRFVTARRGTGLSWVSILGIACIALVLLTGILHVSHTHPNGQIDHDCSLCMTAHQAVQITIAVTFIVSAGPLAWYTLDRYAPVPRQRFLLKLANRPPPVPTAFVA